MASAVGEARKKVDAAVKLPIGYRYDWGGEYKEYLASQEQMKVILPMTVLLILTILFFLYGNLKFPLIIFFSVLVTEPVGGLLAQQLGRVPIAGSVATVSGLRLTAESLAGRRNRIGTVTVERIAPAGDGQAGTALDSGG